MWEVPTRTLNGQGWIGIPRGAAFPEGEEHVYTGRGEGAGEGVDLDNGVVASEMERLLMGWSLPLQARLDEKFGKIAATCFAAWPTPKNESAAAERLVEGLTTYGKRQ